MRLAEPSVVLQAMGIAESPGSLANALAALDLTGPIVAAMLDTDLDEKATLDEWDYNELDYLNLNYYPAFRLTNGFVNREETITFGGDIGTGSVVGDWNIDYKNGVIRAKAKPISGTLTIQYTAGFPTKGTNKILDTLPEWLKQAGIMAAVHYLQITPANIVNKQNVSMKDVTEPLRVLLSRSLNPQFRPRMSLEFAVRTQTVE
jgi:hypothetical protein